MTAPTKALTPGREVIWLTPNWGTGGRCPARIVCPVGDGKVVIEHVVDGRNWRTTVVERRMLVEAI